MPLLTPFPRSKSIKICLRCLKCGQTFTQRAERLFYDLGTVERKQYGEQVPFVNYAFANRLTRAGEAS